MLNLLTDRKRQLQAMYRKAPDIELTVRLREVNLLIKRVTRQVNSGALPIIASTEDVAKERAECANLCDEMSATECNMSKTWRSACRDMSNEIRARGQE